MKHRHTFAVVGLFLTMLAGGCRSSRASAEECGQILDRIVAIELQAKGFKDPALVERRQREMRNLLAADLTQCVGKRIGRSAMACVRYASSANDLTHDCLR